MQRRYYILLGIFVITGLLIGVVFLVMFLFRSNMVLPRQPELTNEEVKYFKALEMECDCNVTREVDPRALRYENTDNENGWYMLTCSVDSCNEMNNTDSLSIVAERIANDLHVNILGDSFKYEYREITVGFVCNTGSSADRNLYFDYKPSDLLR